MSKALPPLPQQDDLVESINALSLTDKGTIHLPPRIENLDGLSLADDQPADLPLWVENFKGLSLADKEPSQTKRIIPQRRQNLPQNRNPSSVPGTSGKPEKKRLDLFASHQTTFRFDVGPGLAVNGKVDDRPPIKAAPRQPVVNQKVQPTVPSEATVRPSIQTESRTPIPAPKDTPIIPALAPLHEPSGSTSSSAGAKPVKNVTLDDRPAVNQGTPTKSSLTPPSSPGNLVQCNAITQAGRQCRNKARRPATDSHLDPPPVLYCAVHQRQATLTVQRSRTTVRTRNDADLERLFSEYIPKYLQSHTQEALKEEMKRTLSSVDGPGYIYVFEIRDPKRPDVVQLKVGRTINVNKRLDQWSRQCGSQVQIPRGWWPGTIEDNNRSNVSLLRGNIKAGDPGPFCHRLERLVHLELSDLSSYEPYYRHPDWLNGTSQLPSAASARPTRAIRKCSDCGKEHKEIYTFHRREGGCYTGHEWMLIVRPVIKRWGAFVKEYYASQADTLIT